MATLNQRIKITVPEEIAILLNKTAEQSKKSVSKVALDLIEWAIEEREDMYFSKIADDILHSNPKMAPKESFIE
jgi:predicted DNA-binding protein